MDLQLMMENGGMADKENRGSSVYIAAAIDKSGGKGGKGKEKVESTF